MTFQNIANTALLEIQAIGQGEPLDPSQVSDLQVRGNAMLDAWSSQNTMIFTVPRTVYSLTANAQVYTLGPGTPPPGAIQLSTVRPPKIELVSLIQLSNPDLPLELPIEYLTVKQWQRVPVKNIPSTLSLAVWDDEGFPYRTLTFTPIANTQIDIAIYAWTALQQFGPNFNTDYTFPPGYMEAVLYNLALRAAPSYMPPGVAPNPITVQMAKESLWRVKRYNSRLNYADIDPAILDPRREVFNYYTGSSYIPGGSPW